MFVGFLLTISANGWSATSRIAQIIIEGNEPVSAEQIRSVMTLKEGGYYSVELEQETLELLDQWGRFESVSLSKEQSSAGWILTVDVLPGLIISSIEFRGHFPYLTSRIRRNVGIRVGEVYSRDQIIGEVKKIKRFFERDGYFGTAVRVKEKVNAKKGVIAITFRVKKGSRLRWRNIHVEGNTVFPDGFFRSKINAWVPYKPSRLRSSLDKIRKAYKKKGYPRARVRTEKLHRDFGKKKVDIWLEVSEHSDLSVYFHGNRRMGRRTLMETITFFKEEAYDNYELRESTRAIVELYQSRGFLEVQARAEKTQEAPGKLRVDFYIEEGPQTLVKNINVEGLGDIPEDKIVEGFTLKEAGFFSSGYLSMPALARDRRRLPHLFDRQGYSNSKLVDTEIRFNEWHDRADVTFTVDEGLRQIVATVQFPGASQIALDEVQEDMELDLKPGAPFNQFSLQNDAHKITNYYTDHGFPYAEVSPEFQLDPSSGRVDVSFIIDEGPLVKIDEILIIGIDHMRPSTIRSGLSIDSGDPYSREKILKGESVLRKLGSLASVKVDALGLEEHLDTVHLLVKVEEQKKYVFDISFSYNTDDKAAGSVKMTNLDVFGFGKRMSTKVTFGFDLRRGEWNFIDPRLFGGDVEMVLGLFVQDEDRPSFQVTDLGGTIAFLKDIGRTMSVLVRYEVQRAIFRGGTPSEDEETEDRTLPHGTLSFNYDSRDYFADPRHGIFGIISTDYFHSLFGFGASFVKLRGQYIHYYSPVSRFTLVNSLRMEGILPLGDGVVVPRSELLFIGGDYSIRGFDQDRAGPIDAEDTPIGQKFAMLLNTELQFRIAGGFKIAGFFDTAAAAQEFDLSTSALRHSAGVGLRYVTPVGPIRFDYGIPLDPRDSSEESGRLHFTFGSAF